MSFTTTCPGCNTVVRLGWESVGAEAECGRCGAIFEARPKEEPSPVPSGFEPRLRPPTRSAANDGSPIAALILGCANLVLWACPLIGIGTGFLGLYFGNQALRGPRRGFGIIAILFSVVGLMLSLGWGILLGVCMSREAENGQQPVRNKPPFLDTTNP